MIDLEFDFEEHITSQKLVSGAWSLLQFLPNPSTSEAFNIGVVIKLKGQPLKAKLLKNMDALSVMYGKEAAQNFSFLLTLIESYFKDNVNLRLENITLSSPQIKISKKTYIQGVSENSILENLFKHMVPLSWNENIEKGKDTKKSINSQELRVKTLNELNKINPQLKKEICPDSKISIKIDQKYFELDLPIYRDSNQNSLLEKNRIIFASIASTRQRDKIHREHDLIKSGQDLNIAKQKYREQSIGKFFILSSDGFLNREETQAINNEIDDTAWLLKQNNIEVEIYNSPKEIASGIINLFY